MRRLLSKMHKGKKYVCNMLFCWQSVQYVPKQI